MDYQRRREIVCLTQMVLPAVAMERAYLARQLLAFCDSLNCSRGE